MALSIWMKFLPIITREVGSWLRLLGFLILGRWKNDDYWDKNSEIPKKGSKNYKLTDTDEDKIENQEKASKRIYVEHINTKIKTFQNLKQKYRNRRKRYNLRVNLICGWLILIEVWWLKNKFCKKSIFTVRGILW